MAIDDCNISKCDLEEFKTKNNVAPANFPYLYYYLLSQICAELKELIAEGSTCCPLYRERDRCAYVLGEKINVTIEETFVVAKGTGIITILNTVYRNTLTDEIITDPITSGQCCCDNVTNIDLSYNFINTAGEELQVIQLRGEDISYDFTSPIVVGDVGGTPNIAGIAQAESEISAYLLTVPKTGTPKITVGYDGVDGWTLNLTISETDINAAPSLSYLNYSQEGFPSGWNASPAPLGYIADGRIVDLPGYGRVQINHNTPAVGSFGRSSVTTVFGLDGVKDFPDYRAYQPGLLTVFLGLSGPYLFTYTFLDGPIPSEELFLQVGDTNSNGFFLPTTVTLSDPVSYVGNVWNTGGGAPHELDGTGLIISANTVGDPTTSADLYQFNAGSSLNSITIEVNKEQNNDIMGFTLGRFLESEAKSDLRIGTNFGFAQAELPTIECI